MPGCWESPGPELAVTMVSGAAALTNSPLGPSSQIRQLDGDLAPIGRVAGARVWQSAVEIRARSRGRRIHLEVRPRADPSHTAQSIRSGLS